MYTNDDISYCIDEVRTALAEGDVEAAALVQALAPRVGEISPVCAVDLLERACTFGRLASVRALFDVVGEFAYCSWALALALRCAHEDVARELLARGVDLLGPVVQPTRVRMLIPHEGTFTRFDLTRQSPTLFLNPMDPTVSTEVFETFGRPEHIAGSPYAAPCDLAATCDLVAKLAEEGAFDAVVFDDLFRAAMVKAWHALRHEGSHDEQTAETCLALGARLLQLHHERGMGDGSIELILGNLIVPKASPRVIAFVCEQAPRVFLGRLAALSWLQDDPQLVRDMVPHLSPADEELNGTLLTLLAKNGFVDELAQLESWERTLTPANLERALDAASAAGHAEAAAWCLAHLHDAQAEDPGLGSLDDLFL